MSICVRRPRAASDESSHTIGRHPDSISHETIQAETGCFLGFKLTEPVMSNQSEKSLIVGPDWKKIPIAISSRVRHNPREDSVRLKLKATGILSQFHRSRP